MHSQNLELGKIPYDLKRKETIHKHMTVVYDECDTSVSHSSDRRRDADGDNDHLDYPYKQLPKKCPRGILQFLLKTVLPKFMPYKTVLTAEELSNALIALGKSIKPRRR